MPFTRADQRAGYWWEISMRQVEVSRTLVFDAPRRARAFFEALIADNLDIGRPANVEIIFNRHIRRATPGVFRTAIDRPVTTAPSYSWAPIRCSLLGLGGSRGDGLGRSPENGHDDTTAPGFCGGTDWQLGDAPQSAG
jgi:hypothetical protein